MSLNCTIEFTFARLNPDFTWTPRVVVKTLSRLSHLIKNEEEKKKMADFLQKEGEVIYSMKIIPKDGKEFWESGCNSYRVNRDCSIEITKEFGFDSDFEWETGTQIEDFCIGADILDWLKLSPLNEPIETDDGKFYLLEKDFHDDNFHVYYSGRIPVEWVEEYFC